MPKTIPTHYIAVRESIWAVERLEFRVFLKARSQGITANEGDLERMGSLIRARMSSTVLAQTRNGFPKATDGHPRFDITNWTPEDYQKCLKALEANALDGFTPRA